MITEKNLIFYGVDSNIAEKVIKNKLDDKIKLKLAELHCYNVVFCIGEQNEDKDFLFGKIIQLYLLNKMKAVITDIYDLFYNFESDTLFLDLYRIIIIKNVDIIEDTKFLDLLKMLPYLYRNTTFILDLQSKNNIFKVLSKSYISKIKTLILEV